jgi:hypothetical protein
MSRQPIDRNYVSEMDELLNDFDKNHPILTQSQQKERNKYLRIYQLRDTSERPPKNSKKIWEGF